MGENGEECFNPLHFHHFTVKINISNEIIF
nr:MAG TPA: PBZ domain protein [Caudoviricetes sp.]